MENNSITSNSNCYSQFETSSQNDETDHLLSRDSRIAACMPATLPFPESRLDRGNLLTTHTGRDQFSCPNGSYVLTDPTLLPVGGQKRRLDIATPELRTFLVGDMGFPSDGRAAILNHAATSCDNLSDRHSSMAVGLGDWVYPRGPVDRSPEETARVKETVLNAFEELATHTPTFGILGNHEYGCDQFAGDIDYMMAMANEVNVEFPGRYYSLEVKGADWTMDCFSLDSSVLASDPKQVEWFKEQVNESVELETNSHEKRWRVAFAHHPLQSYGIHHDETKYISELLGKSLQDIDLYACGHEHDLEYVVQTGTDLPPVLLSGTTSECRDIIPGQDSLFASSKYGYATVNVSKDAMNIDFLTFPQKRTINMESKAEVTFHQTIERG